MFQTKCVEKTKTQFHVQQFLYLNRVFVRYCGTIWYSL